MIANYHTHTARCKHAEGEDREYVEAAILKYQDFRHLLWICRPLPLAIPRRLCFRNPHGSGRFRRLFLLP